MALHLNLQRESNVPLYRQIAGQIRARIAEGAMPAGARLPTVRQLAADAGVTRLTVQNAYQELQTEGWIEATVGRGTFVSAATRARLVATTIGRDTTPDAVIQEIVQLDQGGGVKSLANASPDPALFPEQEFWSALKDQESRTRTLTHYGSSQGEARLRVALVDWLAERDVEAMPDDILVTAGVTQGLALVGQALARPGDVVLVEQPTYVGLLHTLRSQGLRMVGIPMDEAGIDIEALERAVIREQPRFLYTIPNFQNPTGRCMAPARREALLAVARRHSLVVVEDDIYARIAYGGPPPGTLMAMDRDDLVIHVSSFAKIFMPGLRLGYVVAPPALQTRLISLRRATDLCSPPLLQHALADMLMAKTLQRHLARVLPRYRERRDAVCGALRRQMPKEACWTEPDGGFCVWLTLPHHNFGGIQQAALRRGWAFAPGSAFMLEDDGAHHLRICFGHLLPAKIHEGIGVLAELVRERLDRPAAVQDWTPLV